MIPLIIFEKIHDMVYEFFMTTSFPKGLVFS